MTEAEWRMNDDPIAMLKHRPPNGLQTRRLRVLLKTKLFLHSEKHVEREESDEAEFLSSLHLPTGWYVCPRGIGMEKRAAQIRCVIPYQPVKRSRHWRTTTVVALATSLYDSCDFSAMPLLADALQDASCENEQMLAHCRGSGPHVRGCWVVDLLLQKH